MPHVLAMFDSEYLHHYDLPEPEVTVTIEKVEAGELTATGGRKSKRPLVTFRGASKKLALNKTNARAILALYGADTAAWPGKKVILYTTITSMAGEDVQCIRVRPMIPSDK